MNATFVQRVAVLRLHQTRRRTKSSEDGPRCLPAEALVQSLTDTDGISGEIKGTDTFVLLNTRLHRYILKMLHSVVFSVFCIVL